MAATAQQTNIAGLPRRMVQDGIISEEQLQEATEKAKEAKVPLIAYDRKSQRSQGAADCLPRQ